MQAQMQHAMMQGVTSEAIEMAIRKESFVHLQPGPDGMKESVQVAAQSEPELLMPQAAKQDHE